MKIYPVRTEVAEIRSGVAAGSGKYARRAASWIAKFFLAGAPTALTVFEGLPEQIPQAAVQWLLTTGD